METTFAENLFTVSGLLSEAECLQLIERGEGLGFIPAAVQTASGPQMKQGIRNNDRVEFDDPELSALLWLRCLPFVPPELEGGTPIGLDDHFRYYRYDVGQRFMRHTDGTVRRSAIVRSRLTCLFYLNDGFTGGETVFYSSTKVEGVRTVEHVIVPRMGDALFFLHDWWHEGKELLEGRKYVLRSDVFFQFPEG